jgi:hypothetical protein
MREVISVNVNTEEGAAVLQEWKSHAVWMGICRGAQFREDDHKCMGGSDVYASATEIAVIVNFTKFSKYFL